jgi:hypothetical protein
MSLIESAIAVAIAGTALAAATPAIMESREHYMLSAAAQDVSTALYAAKIHAISENRDCRFRAASTASYVVECQQTSGAAWSEIERRTLPKGFTLTANNRPEFHPRGNVSPTATVAVWNPGGRVLRVVVNTNGRVKIQ